MGKRIESGNIQIQNDYIDSFWVYGTYKCKEKMSICLEHKYNVICKNCRQRFGSHYGRHCTIESYYQRLNPEKFQLFIPTKYYLSKEEIKNLDSFKKFLINYLIDEENKNA